MWIEMFFIKFEGKIENFRGNAENIFNFTQELMKNIEIHIFFLVKNEKTVEKSFWESYLLVDIAFCTMRPFFNPPRSV